MSNCTLLDYYAACSGNYDISEQPIGTIFKVHESTDRPSRNDGKELTLHAA